jgi:hypothetical protein
MYIYVHIYVMYRYWRKIFFAEIKKKLIFFFREPLLLLLIYFFF